MGKSSRRHDDATVELLRDDPTFAAESLTTALEESDQPGGSVALLPALRHVAEAQGVAAVAERAGISRESLHRALSPTNGDPTVTTLLAILTTAGLKLEVRRPLS